MKILKNLTKDLILVLIVLVSIASCKKGDKGDTGPKGEQGVAGQQGADGSTVLNGNTVPITTVGKVGDFYLNTTTSTLYGPKTTTGWGNGTLLKGATGATGSVGATGAAGTAGSKILSGTGAPAATLGGSGDFYFDKGSSTIYGPKTGSGWGLATSLKGATGTANVLYSGWVYAKNFRDSTIDNSLMHVADITEPALTTDVLNKAVINVYFTYGGGVFPLPHITYAGNKTSVINYAPRFKHFNITRFTLDNSNSVNLSTVLQYRYVIIPGGNALPANAVKK
ncbi:MAG: hypothetical protein JKY70_14895 [Mucilaginibacter sp.]|nr:hypothetical protein [Mucilaginibacter sp.]